MICLWINFSSDPAQSLLRILDCGLRIETSGNKDDLHHVVSLAEEPGLEFIADCGLRHLVKKKYLHLIVFLAE
jgi:hypothetical protein